MMAINSYTGEIHRYSIGTKGGTDGITVSVVAAESSFFSHVRSSWLNQLIAMSNEIGPSVARVVAALPAGSRWDGDPPLYDWAIAGERIFGYGPVSTAPDGTQHLATLGEAYQLGFFEARKEKDSPSLQDVKLMLPFENYIPYILGYNYVATNELGTFFVAMESAPAIYARFPLKPESFVKLTSMAGGYDEIQIFTTHASEQRDTFELFAELERLRIPVGLYGYGRLLYVLTRRPSTDGMKTEWWMHQIDPETDEILGRVRLPTSANHLSVVVARDNWFFFEKGPVEGGGIQNIDSLLTIPAKWITAPETSPLNSDDEIDACLSESVPAFERMELRVASLSPFR
ncbi:MAG: hypothetical protein GY835_06530 [bacterium]|nr:hypothetical protein [bacterium]